MTMRFSRVLLGCTLLLPVLGAAQTSGATALPFDPQVKTGVLPNGLHYYVRKNAKPEKRADLRLVVNVGSILEEDNQLGYAHFIEHMAFNGTTHYQKNALVNYLQSIGLRFGADLNAGTSFDETIYDLEVPTDTAKIVDKAIEILADWAHEQLFDSTEVVNERGVVREEWRLGKGAGERMQRQWFPVALKGSKYAERIPIGTEKSIMSANPSGLRKFYQDWYRPDLMAVVAVGDFDPAAVEALIKAHFGGIPAVPNGKPRVVAVVPPNQAPLVAVASDKEATGTIVQVGFKRAHEPVKTIDDFRRSITQSIYIGLINNRLSELTQKPNAPFNGASMSMSGFFARGLDAFELGANVKDGGAEAGLAAIFTEIRRADEFGFLQTELDRAKTSILRSSERAFAERTTQPHGAYTGAYISAFLNGTTPVSVELSDSLVKQIVPTITLAEVNGLAAKWITDDNRVIIATAPAKPGLKTPTDKDLLAVFNKAGKEKLTAYTEAAVDATPLLSKPPTPGRVTSERTIADAGVTEWKLSNGARVLVKPTDFKADEILFVGTRDGGTSQVSDDEYLTASFASRLVSLGGAGSFGVVDLRKKLAGKVAGVSVSINPYSENIAGNAAPRDLETMFQLLYLQLTEPRLDKDAWLAQKDRLLTGLANRNAVPEAVFLDTVSATMTQNEFRARPATARTYDQLSLVHALEFYKDEFSDVGDFTFAFVGNVQLDALKPLVEKYLASLPAAGRVETWKDVEKGPPTGVIDKTVRKGIEAKALTEFYFTGPYQDTPDNRFTLSAMMAVFQNRLTETLREQLGGTYSPSAGFSAGHIPQPRYTIQVRYNSSPENVPKLTASVFSIIDSLAKSGPSQADVEKVREQFTRSHESALKENRYWIGVIGSREEKVDDITKRETEYQARLKNLTPAQIQEAAKLYFNKQNYARFVLLPENKK